MKSYIMFFLLITPFLFLILNTGCRKEIVYKQQVPSDNAPYWNRWTDTTEQIPLGYSIISIANTADSSIWILTGNETSLCVLRSNNLGLSWKYFTMSNIALEGSQISASDNQHAWISNFNYGYNNAHTNILYTKDGGNNWTTSSNYSGFARNIHFFNSSDGFIENSSMYYNGWEDSTWIYLTSDGGITWKPVLYFQNGIQGSQCPNSFPSIKWNGDTIYFPSAPGRIMMSYDRGYNWKVINTDPEESKIIYSIAMLTSKTFAFISAYSETEVKLGFTVNGGSTWFYKTVFITNNAFILPCKSLINGYIICSHSEGLNYEMPHGTWFASADGQSIQKIDDVSIINATTAGNNLILGVATKQDSTQIIVKGFYINP
jgi:photosystem II stability/assembly factor-like uncharacterized protein